MTTAATTTATRTYSQRGVPELGDDEGDGPGANITEMLWAWPLTVTLPDAGVGEKPVADTSNE